MILDCFAICDPGRVRSENQDNLYINGIFRKDASDSATFRHADKTIDCGLYAVADGMGGEKHGELASLVTLQEMHNVNLLDGCQSIVQYLIERNATICDLIDENNGMRIGSTFAGLCINGRTADIVNIGDSRVYLLRDGNLIKLSRDHTAIQQMIEFGVVTREAARQHPDRHKLTQHLGIFPSEMIIEPHTRNVDIQAGDVFLLCSDGLTDMLEDAVIENVLSTLSTVEEMAEKLFIASLRNGGKDNITILLVQASQGGANT